MGKVCEVVCTIAHTMAGDEGVELTAEAAGSSEHVGAVGAVGAVSLSIPMTSHGFCRDLSRLHKAVATVSFEFDRRCSFPMSVKLWLEEASCRLARLVPRQRPNMTKHDKTSCSPQNTEYFASQQPSRICSI